MLASCALSAMLASCARRSSRYGSSALLTSTVTRSFPHSVVVLANDVLGISFSFQLVVDQKAPTSSKSSPARGSRRARNSCRGGLRNFSINSGTAGPAYCVLLILNLLGSRIRRLHGTGRLIARCCHVFSVALIVRMDLSLSRGRFAVDIQRN